MSSVPAGTTCNCDGSVNGLPFDAPDFFYGLTGDVSVSTQAQTACSNAVQRLQALGVDCASGAPWEAGSLLDTLYNEELGTIQGIVASEPVSNPLQKAADIAMGTATNKTPIVPKPSANPPSKSPNYALIIGFFALLALGFIFVFRTA